MLVRYRADTNSLHVVRKKILLNGSILGMRRADIERKVDEMVAFSVIQKFLETRSKDRQAAVHALAFAVGAILNPSTNVDAGAFGPTK